jgi:hypothetical protein
MPPSSWYESEIRKICKVIWMLTTGKEFASKLGGNKIYKNVHILLYTQVVILKLLV